MVGTFFPIIISFFVSFGSAGFGTVVEFFLVGSFVESLNGPTVGPLFWARMKTV